MDPVLTPLPPIDPSIPSIGTELPAIPEPPDNPQPTRESGGWSEIWLVVAIWVLPLTCTALGTRVWGFRPLHPNFQNWYSIAYSVGALSLGVFLVHRSSRGWRAFGLTPFGLADVGKGVVVALILFALYGLMRELAYGKSLKFHGQSPWAMFRRPPTEADRMLLFASVVSSAVAEELLMCAVLITRLRDLLASTPSAIVASALLVAFYNLDLGMMRATMVFVEGLVMGAAFCWWRSVWPVAVASSLFGVLLFALGDAFPNLIMP